VKPFPVVALLAALAGCASTPPPPKPPPGGPIEFTLPIWPDAVPHSFADDRGHIVVIDAWASWCEPCKAELPQLNALAQQWKAQGVRVYAVNIDTGGDTVGPFVTTYNIGLPILLDPGGGVLTTTLGLKNMPTTWVFNEQGTFVLAEEGKVTLIAEKVNSMLAQSTKP
jgi:thiol-disulfide isomerase/thioredoxin